MNVKVVERNPNNGRRGGKKGCRKETTRGFRGRERLSRERRYDIAKEVGKGKGKRKQGKRPETRGWSSSPRGNLFNASRRRAYGALEYYEMGLCRYERAILVPRLWKHPSGPASSLCPRRLLGGPWRDDRPCVLPPTRSFKVKGQRSPFRDVLHDRPKVLATAQSPPFQGARCGTGYGQRKGD